MTVHAPFQGINGGNQVVTPAGASASVNVAPVSKSIRFVNSGANICYVRVGNGAQVATVADTPIRASESLTVQKADGDDTVAHISAAGTTLNIQPGEGGF